MEENKTTSPKRSHNQAHLLLLLRVMASGVWMAVLTAIIFGCLGYIVADLRYQPQYMTRTTFVVHQRGNYSTKEDFSVDSLLWRDDQLYGWLNKNTKPDGTKYDLDRDGLRIYTTINYNMQRYAEEAVAEHLGKDLQKSF